MTADREPLIRRATPDDADIITEFNLRLALETENRKLDPRRLAAGVRGVLAAPERGIYELAEFGDRVVGQLMLTREWSDWRNGEFLWIQSVYVDEDYRRHGVFAALYRHVEREARDNPEICGLRLYVEADNRAAQATYQRLGMKVTSYGVMEVELAGRVHR